MAGDWIKMRGNLWDDPRVGRLCDLTEQSEAAVIGGLYWLWAAADQHTEDGCMPGLSLRQIDRKTGIPGFGQALCDVGWLIDDPQGVVIPRFDEHNGASAKRRTLDAQRKANSRTPSAPSPAHVREMSASEADNKRTNDGQIADGMRRSAELEKEKRREEIPPKPPKGDEPEGFAAFWAAWPNTDRKQAKGKCLEAWKKASAERDAAVIVAHVEALKACQTWTKDGGQYIPAPLVYLNQRRWEGAEDQTASLNGVLPGDV